MSLTLEHKASIDARIAQVRAWLGDEAPYAIADQKHLDEYTPERAYWHYGYLCALQDILDLDDRSISQTPGSAGKTT